MKIELSAIRPASLYDEVFLQRYESVFRWALQITKHDHELAEDLVHEVYVRFTVTFQNSGQVNSIDDYLYIALRNSYVSYLRRNAKTRAQQLSVVEFDSVDNALLTVDPRHQIKIHDGLRAVCHYACLRKETSISGSILILRFFHGYFPSEVARILNSSRNVVEARLLSARREAKAYLIDPDSLVPVTKNPVVKVSAKNSAQSYYDTLNDLRNKIFAARAGNCLQKQEIVKLYQTPKSGIPRRLLSHLVSCQSCLDRVNDILELPFLSVRHPLDTLGREYLDEVNVTTQKNERSHTKTMAFAAR